MADKATTALFVTCLVDQFFPDVGEASVRLLEACGRKVVFPSAQTCCGQPAFNMGYGEEARQLARRWIEIFEPYDEVVTPSGSCASMVRLHYPELFQKEPEWQERAHRLAVRVFELSEFLYQQGFDASRSAYTGRVTYHPSCHHLRELKAGEAPLALLRQVPDLELLDLPDAAVCCGFGGAFSIKMPDLSGAMLEAKITAAESTGAQVLTATDCGCLMHLGGAVQKRNRPLRILHVAEILAARAAEA